MCGCGAGVTLCGCGVVSVARGPVWCVGFGGAEVWCAGCGEASRCVGVGHGRVPRQGVVGVSWVCCVIGWLVRCDVCRSGFLTRVVLLLRSGLTLLAVGVFVSARVVCCVGGLPVWAILGIRAGQQRAILTLRPRKGGFLGGSEEAGKAMIRRSQYGRAALQTAAL